VVGPYLNFLLVTSLMPGGSVAQRLFLSSFNYFPSLSCVAWEGITRLGVYVLRHAWRVLQRAGAMHRFAGVRLGWLQEADGFFGCRNLLCCLFGV
jgi:hypothetical protein